MKLKPGINIINLEQRGMDSARISTNLVHAQITGIWYTNGTADFEAKVMGHDFTFRHVSKVAIQADQEGVIKIYPLV